MSPNTERVHRYIRAYSTAYGMMPQSKEIAGALGWRSHNSVYRAFSELEAAGLIRRRGRYYALPSKTCKCPRCGTAINIEDARS